MVGVGLTVGEGVMVGVGETVGLGEDVGEGAGVLVQASVVPVLDKAVIEASSSGEAPQAVSNTSRHKAIT